MKATVHSAALRQLADLTCRAVSTRPLNPILGCVSLTAADGKLAAYATDYDSWLRTAAPADVQTASAVAVSARLLAAVAGAMPAGDVDLVHEGGTLAVVGQGRARSTLPTLPVEDFPAWPESPDGDLRVLSGAAFFVALEVCAKVAEAAPPASPHIRRVTLVPSATGLRLYATDSYRMLVLDLPWWHEPDSIRDVLPVALDPGTVAPMLALAKHAERVTLSFPAAEHPQARFQVGAGDSRAVAAVMGGRGVEYDRLLGMLATDRSVVVEAKALLELAAKVEPFVLVELGDRKARGPAVLTLAGGELGLSAGGDDHGSMSDSIAVAGWDGEAWRTGINPAYLADAVKAVTAGPVRLHVGSPVKPLHVTPADQDAPTAQAVVMPVRIPV